MKISPIFCFLFFGDLLVCLRTTQAASFLQGGLISAQNLSIETSLLVNSIAPVAQSNNAYLGTMGGVCNQISRGQVNTTSQLKDSCALGTDDSLNFLVNDGLQIQDSFGKWIDDFITEPLGSVGDPGLELSSSSVNDSFTSPEQIFSITEVSSGWAYSTEKTKVFFWKNSLPLLQ